MAGPTHGIVGGASVPLESPLEATQDEAQRDAEHQQLVRLANFTKTEDYRLMKQLFDVQIDMWKQYVPGQSGNILGGDAINVASLNNDERGWRWMAADAVITSLNSVIGTYEQAVEIVKNETAK